MDPVTSADNLIRSVWQHRGFPVDPVAIAYELGLEVLQTDMPNGVSGALIKEAGKDATIVVHYSDSDKRKRFTCAHELGHYVARIESDSGLSEYEYVDLRSITSSQGSDEDEIFANQFAANLLMPMDEISRLLKKNKNRFEMAAYFGVSNEAMKYRLAVFVDKAA